MHVLGVRHPWSLPRCGTLNTCAEQTGPILESRQIAQLVQLLLSDGVHWSALVIHRDGFIAGLPAAHHAPMLVVGAALEKSGLLGHDCSSDKPSLCHCCELRIPAHWPQVFRIFQSSSALYHSALQLRHASVTLLPGLTSKSFPDSVNGVGLCGFMKADAFGQTHLNGASTCAHARPVRFHCTV